MLVAVGGILAARAARSRGSGDDEPAKRKMGQMVAENRVKLGLAGTVLLVVCGSWAAPRRLPAAPAATSPLAAPAGTVATREARRTKAPTITRA